jgi:hypothetical protein
VSGLLRWEPEIDATFLQTVGATDLP